MGAANLCSLLRRSKWRFRVRMGLGMLSVFVLSGALICGCGGGGGNTTTPPPTTTTPAVAPTVASSDAQNGAVLVTLASTTPGATIHYTMDGSTPTATSQIYQAPFLVATNLTVKALATASGYSASSVTTQALTPNVPPNTLVWSDEFNNSSSAMLSPTQRSGHTTPATAASATTNKRTTVHGDQTPLRVRTANPNAYADTEGILHIVARKPSPGVYTSARLKSQGPLQLSVRPHRGADQAARIAGNVAGVLVAGQQHRHRRLARLRRTRHHGAHRRQQSSASCRSRASGL